MNAYDWIGTIAAALTTLSFVPQVLQVWRTRCAKDISLVMYIIFTTGVALWMVYGFALGSWPMVVANGVTCLLAGLVLLMKLRFG